MSVGSHSESFVSGSLEKEVDSCVSFCWFCCCALGYDTAGYGIVGKLLNRTCHILCTVASLNRSQFPQDIVDVGPVDTTDCILIAKPTARKSNFNQKHLVACSAKPCG
jgi:hypothetical protein